jgi:hypothetical protein
LAASRLCTGILAVGRAYFACAKDDGVADEDSEEGSQDAKSEDIGSDDEADEESDEDEDDTASRRLNVRTGVPPCVAGLPLWTGSVQCSSAVAWLH